jgi:hypothetical protein
MAQVGADHRSHLDVRTQQLMAQLDETVRVTAIVVVGDHPQSTQGSYEHWSGVRHPAEAGGVTHQPGDAVGARAQGVLIATRCSVEQARNILQHAATTTGDTLVTVAQRILDTASKNPIG